MILKSRITRAIALLISCVLVGFCTFKVMVCVDKADKFYESEDYYSKVHIMSEETNEIYKKLWAVGMMYLRNLDDSGEFKGTKELEEQTIAALQKLGCMDENGNLTIDSVDDCEYMVSYGKQSFGNTTKTYDEIIGLYSLTRRNDNIDYPQGAGYYWHYGTSDFNWYETNYGMTYYYLSGNGIALFDYDTSDYYSYVDELGATIYYKLDGSTPIPYDRLELVSEQYVEDPEEFDRNVSGYAYQSENGIEFVTEAKSYTSDYGEGVEDPYDRELEFVTGNGLYYYNESTGELYKVSENNFTKVQGDETALTIAISPSQATISAYEDFRAAADRMDEDIIHSLIELLPFAAIVLILVLYVLIMGGYSVKDKKFVLSAGDKVFAELFVAVAVFIMLCWIMLFDYNLTSDIRDFFDNYYNSQGLPYFYGLMAAVSFGLLVLILNGIIVRIKCHSLLKTTFIYRVLRFFYRLFSKLFKKIMSNVREHTVSYEMLKNDRFTRRFIQRIAIIVILELLAFLICLAMNAVVLIFVDSILLLGLYIYLSFGDLKAMKRLNEHISAMNEGNFFDRAEKPDSPIYAQTEKLNNISAGMQNAVDKQVQSERMKIDLVTNVSHDLKTPLTSIISYIDLLSAEELPPAARDYVSIIDKKSQRLKVMVADLFDLAKATSRTDVQLEQIDAVVLTGQVIGDLADKIDASGKELRTDIQAVSAPIMADGKRMYRVFQNVIDNALKYSLDGTRIYLTLKNENLNCVITVKNIASYEMKFIPEEIMERFTRGDESRNTEGNGLGLSIAKSFTEACGGQFGISIDGDVFTAVVKLPLFTA